MSRCLLGLLIIALCAFTTLDVRWTVAPSPRLIAMRIVTTGMTPAMVARIHDAASMWASPAVRFVLTTQTSSEAHPAGTIAVGPVVPLGSARTDHYGSAEGIMACSIVIDVAQGGPWWDGAEAPPEGLYDFQTALAHEFGHCLGLNHTTVTEGQPVMSAQLHAGSTGGWRRALAPDDVAGRDALWPVRVAPVVPATRRSGCSVWGG